jgi:hypothetical protein
MASDSRLRRLTVRNRSAEGGIAIYFPMTANAGAEEVAAEAFGRMATQGQYDYHAIRVQGPGADVTLDRVTARYRMEVPPDGPLVGDNVAIAIFGAGKLVVKNSRASAENGWWNIGVAAEAGSECTVLDSVIEVRGRAEGAFGFSAQGGRAELRNTTLAVTCPEDNSWGCAAVYGCEGPVSIHASDVRVVAGARTHQARLLACTGTISGSRLTGPEIYDSWKLIGCTDGDFRPILDRP